MISILLVTLIAAVASLGALGSEATSPPFTYNNESFLLHGKPYQIIGGQIDPQRIPHEYWHDRLYKARAMGLNTIFSYVFWDQIQPTPDSWDTTGQNNIREYFRIAQEVGLNVVLRAGPYVCGEHEWGGFPAWLSEVPGMVVRSNNAPFLAASKKYLDFLGHEFKDLLITNGGPVLMAQIENEYGSYGSDHIYMAAMRDMYRDAFASIPLYTNDGGGKNYLLGGQISGALAETDGSPQVGFAARDQYVTDPSSLGPQLDGEYYITQGVEVWGSNRTHLSAEKSPEKIKVFQEELGWVLANNASFSIYMFHGGTNWGFRNGANRDNAKTELVPQLTSYDHATALDEAGRTTDIYYALRETISSYIPPDSIPDAVENTPLIEIPSIELFPAVALFDSLPRPTRATHPTHMEALGQAHGFILYRHTVRSATSGTLKTGDTPRDRILVYLNGKRTGVIDSIYRYPSTVTLALKPNDVLDILIENLGRVNYGSEIPDQRKGIVGNVTVGSTVLVNWDMFSLSMQEPPASHSPPPVLENLTASGPIFYKGSFNVKSTGDTYLELPGWTKGIVWVNGVILGRYWTVGPQQQLYLPGCYLKKRNNEITVLALEPNRNQSDARGIQTRSWSNNPDPDAPL
ncbi:hypothetical protein O988_06585 [Pseudogymnoascus sp. VKM F-3808]|nr:hypothetical protein O988_06585 [Pseudogymnoascus sp. VKM F-3808]